MLHNKKKFVKKTVGVCPEAQGKDKRQWSQVAISTLPDVQR